MTLAVILRGSGCVTLQHSAEFSITVVPSQNLTTPTSAALVIAPLAARSKCLDRQTSTAA